MANGGPPPDTSGDMLRMQSLIASSMGGKKSGLAAFDVQISNFSPQSLGPLAKNITGMSSMLSSKGQKNGQLNYEAEVLSKMRNKADADLAQQCAAAAPQGLQFREASQAELFGSSGPIGGFAALVGGSRMGPTEVG